LATDEAEVGRIVSVEARSLAFNPKGIVSSSPRLRGTSYLGSLFGNEFNRNAVVALPRQSEIGFRRNPVGVGFHWRTVTQGSSFLATLGFGTESRWDSWRDEFELRDVGCKGLDLKTLIGLDEWFFAVFGGIGG